MAQTGATVVDYMELARALKTRDQDFALNIRMKPKTELIRRDLAPPPADEPAVHFPPSPTEAPLSGLGGGGGGSGSSLLQQHHHYPTGSPYDESPAMQRAPAMQRGGGGGSGSGSGYGAGGGGGGSGWGWCAKNLPTRGRRCAGRRRRPTTTAAGVSSRRSCC